LLLLLLLSRELLACWPASVIDPVMKENISLHHHGCVTHAVLHQCRRARLMVARAAAATSRQQQHSHVHQLSIVLLINKNLEKKLGRCVAAFGMTSA
jgi:hypothetical protein